MNRTTPGMVIGIPIAESGDMRPAKVLFCSKRYKSVILVAFGDGSRREAQAGDFNPTAFDGQRVYTGAQAVGRRWPVLGHCALTEDEKSASLRIVAGDVWLADEHLRPATPEDLKSLPTMSVAGAALVEKWAKQ
jgi:hypothetical protein